jgi:TolB-like protein/DNA-binding winged helix-turn-helix (wHTH) protein/Flp pilus assembly protein TadD
LRAARLFEGSSKDMLYEFGKYRLDDTQRVLTRADQRLQLPPKSFDLLLLLVRGSGRAFSKQELLSTLWPDAFVEEANLSFQVSTLRKTLGEESDLIETVPKHGYRFAGPVRQVEPDTSLAALPRRPPLLVVGLAIAAVALTVGLVTWSRLSPPAPVIHSIAVLPLRDTSPNPQEGWFADGLTDAVTSDLARVSALRVISRQSTLAFRNSADPMEAIGRRLGADALIEGSVALVDGRVRMTLRLVHAATDRQLWTGTYERKLADVLALQADVASTVAEEVRAAVTADEHNAFTNRQTVDPEAYVLYLRGIHFFNERTAAATQTSIDNFQQAIARDPSFAAAYGGLALSYSLRVEGASTDKVASLARAATAKALALDPTQPDALVVLAQSTFLIERNWREALRQYDRILQQYPNHVTARSWRGSILTEVAPIDEAIAERRRALQIDPLSNPVNNSMGAVLAQAKRYDEAIAAFKTTIALAPAYGDPHGQLGFAYLKTGRRDEGIAEIETCARLDGSVRMEARLAHAYGLVGRQNDARRLLRDLFDRSQKESVSPVWFAHVYAGLGDRDQAFAKLEETYAQGAQYLMRLKSDPLLDPIKGDPRFADLVRRLNLPWP